MQHLWKSATILKNVEKYYKYEPILYIFISNFNLKFILLNSSTRVIDDN